MFAGLSCQEIVEWFNRKKYVITKGKKKFIKKKTYKHSIEVFENTYPYIGAIPS